MRKLMTLAALLPAMASKRWLFARLTLAAAVAVSLLWIAGRGAQGGSFNPTWTVSVANTVADTPSDVTFDLDIPEGDVYFSSSITFWPAAWQITPSSDVDIGVQRGTLEATPQYGFFNSPCSMPAAVGWDALNATTDKSQTVTYEDASADSNGDGNADVIDMYPDFNDRILGPAQPIVRQAGVLKQGDIVIQVLLYDPGATIAGETLDPALGQPMVTLLENRGDPEAVRTPPGSGADDDCTPLTSTSTAFGMAEDGTVLLKTPKEGGTYTFHDLAVGERDADGDGYEADIDPCPLDPDPTWDPRAASAVGPGDADGDGLPSSCDPDDNDANNDEDSDGYSNRKDNCPLVANVNQKDSDADEIGDACDPNPDNADSEGEAPEALVSQDVTITEAATPAVETPTPAVTPAPTPAVTPEEEEDEGFPVWAIIVIVMVAVVVVSALGATLVLWGRRARP